jgi:hypothetical protein
VGHSSRNLRRSGCLGVSGVLGAQGIAQRLNNPLNTQHTRHTQATAAPLAAGRTGTGLGLPSSFAGNNPGPILQS